jgi:taurine transport system substrate-binding protein
MTDHPALHRRSLLAAGGALAATGLGAGRAHAAAPATVRVGYFISTDPTMLAKADGWFQDGTGGKIAWTEMGSGAEINTAIAAGSLDFGLGIGSSPCAAGIAQQLPYKLIGMVNNIGGAEEMTVRKAAHITKPADFIGKKLATPFGSTSHFRMLGFLKTNNIPLNKVTLLDMNPDAIVAAWSRGEIDAAYVWPPAKSKLIANGGAVYDTWEKLDKAGYDITNLIVVADAFAKQYPASVVGFLKAYGRAMDSYAKDPAGAVKVIAQQAGVSEAVAMADIKEYDFITLKQQLGPDWLGTKAKPGKFISVLHATSEFLVQQRSIRKAPPISAFAAGTDTSFLARAIA